MADQMQGSLTGNTLNAPTSAAPNQVGGTPSPTQATADGPDLDALFANLEKQLTAQSQSNQSAISTLGQQSQSVVQATTPPAPQPVPATSSPTARALATFGAGMGSSLTRNPSMLTNVQNTIAGEDEDARKVTNQNYALRTAFDQKKQSDLLSTQLRMLEMKAEEQIKAGDRDGALASVKAQTALAEKLRKIHLEDNTNAAKELLGVKLKNSLAVVGARGDETRKSQEAKDKLLTGGMTKDELAEYHVRSTAIRAGTSSAVTDLATTQGGVGLDTEEGTLQLARLKQAEDAQLRALASEIRGRHPAPAAGGGTGATHTPAAATPAIAVDAHGIPTDPIRRAHYLQTHPAK